MEAAPAWHRARGSVRRPIGPVEVPGVDIVGPLPAELDAVTVFSGAVFAASPKKGAGMALLRFLSAPDAAPIYARKCLEALRAAEPVSRSGRVECR